MKINNNVYDVLKYLAQVGLPALATFVFTVGPIWNLGHTDEIAKTIVAVNVLLGALLVLNQVKYNNSDVRFDGTIDPYYADQVTSPAALNVKNPDRAQEKKEVLLKVRSIEDAPPTRPDL